METDEYVRANREMWDQTADVYREEGFAKLLAEAERLTLRPLTKRSAACLRLSA